MSDTDQLSAEEAICQILSEGEALEFIDVVNEVQKRFRIDVTSTEVEQVYRNLTKKSAEVEPPSARISMELMSKPPSEDSAADSTTGKSEDGSGLDDLGKALQFVRAVGGISNAKRLLDELESAMKG